MQKPILNPQYDSDRLITAHIKFQQQIQVLFTQFLQSWSSQGTKKYVQQAQKMLISDKHIMVISSSDLYHFDNSLADTVMNQFSRYERLLNKTLTVFMHQVETSIDPSDEEEMAQRQKDDYENANDFEQYEVAFDRAIVLDNLDSSVRNLKCQMLGKLRSIVGTVTRVSEIRPELLEGVFQCGFCGRMSQKIPQQYKYTTPKKCLALGCANNLLWELNNKRSVFADFQRVRVQQDASKIPPGSMPRSIDVILRNQNIEKGQPGDQIHVVGYLTVVPDIQSMLKPGERTAIFTRNPNTRRQFDQGGINGIKGVKQLSYKLCLMGNNVFVMNNQFNEQVLTEEEAEEGEVGLEKGYNQEEAMVKLFQKLNETQIMTIKRIKQHPKVYENLAQSLFHEIYGHSQIKKALLLQLLGGVHKKTQTKISLRGDINILIVGDPSTAKSQFLKCVNKFVPRSVYTNGKTTTAAGLTASVVRDPQTGNVSIQAGALLLADNGICCIDEFDKMDVKDQVAIHEAMEQQTISIAKAGIQATLHARTSILAAANPLFGRYDKSQSLRKNINISPPIMSRFDLYFIICDEINDTSDLNLSQFIVSMHQNKKQIKIQKPHTISEVKQYLTIAKKIKPRITRQAAQDLRRFYVELRRNDKQQQNSQYQVTVRQLESMIRLSEALAKLHLDLEIKSEYVREAYRLLSCAIVKLEKPAIELGDERGMSESEKNSMGLRGILSNREGEKKQKKISISHQTFTQIQRDIFRLFEQKEQRHREGQRKNRIEDTDLYLTEQDMIAYLTAINYENGELASESENKKVTKLYHAVINHMLKEKMLIVIEENHDNPMMRLLNVHPNVVLSNQREKKEIEGEKLAKRVNPKIEE